MDLLEKVLNCNEEEVDDIVKSSIESCNTLSDKKEILGFTGLGNTNEIHKGFINLDTRIKYASQNIEDYSMKTTDYFYEFAHFIRNNNIDNIKKLIYNLEYFINNYFGYPQEGSREEVFNYEAMKNSKTDDEFFTAIENNQIGDLKGKGVALCTEKSALAEQILSMYGIESYYTIGCVENEKEEVPHCYNIVKRKNDYAILDYSLPVTFYKTDKKSKSYIPFIGTMTNEEFINFINGDMSKEYSDYYIKDGKKVQRDNTRTYQAKTFEIKKDISRQI